MKKNKKIYNIKWKQIIACYIVCFLIISMLAIVVNLFTNYDDLSRRKWLLGTCIQLAVTAILMVSHVLYIYFADRQIMEQPRKIWAMLCAMIICYALIEFSTFWEYGLYVVPIALCAVMLSLLISDKSGFYSNFIIIMLCFLQYINWQDTATLDSEPYFYLLFGGVVQVVFASYIFGKGYKRVSYVIYVLFMGVVLLSILLYTSYYAVC